MDNLIKKYKNSEIFMVGALDSLGVPYTIDNIEMKSFVELVVDEMKRNGININYVNLCSLGRNKTWELEKILESDYTIEKYVKFNKAASEFVIQGKRTDESWNFPTNPKFTENYYSNIVNGEYKITTELRKVQKPIFLYSCGGMNIRSYLNITTDNPDIGKIAKEVIFRCVKHIRQTEKDVESCINKILSLNPSMEIYVLGVYAMLDNQVARDLVFPLVNLYNSRLNKIISKYEQVHYIDIVNVKNMVAPNDMHPTFEGQKYIAKQIIKCMDRK